MSENINPAKRFLRNEIVYCTHGALIIFKQTITNRFKDRLISMDTCSKKCVNQEEVKKTLKTMPSPDTIQGLSEIFKALGDASRIKIVTALLDREHCVCDLSVLCGQSESAVSHQLRVLRTLRIVKNRRQGKNVYYSLDDDHVRALLQMSIEHISH